jgi:hypothetical protein
MLEKRILAEIGKKLAEPPARDLTSDSLTDEELNQALEMHLSGRDPGPELKTKLARLKRDPRADDKYAHLSSDELDALIEEKLKLHFFL